MARKNSREENKRLINLLFLNLLLFSSGILWLDYLGIINIKENIYPNLAKIPLIKYVVPKREADPYLLEKEEQRKEQVLKELEWDKIKKAKEKIEKEKLELKKEKEKLKEKENELIVREKELKEKYRDKETYKQKIAQQAKYFVSMRPEDAVKRLNQMDDLTVIDILKEIERQAQEKGKQSVVPYYLSLMEPKRAAMIQRKMLIVEEDNNTVFETNK